MEKRFLSEDDLKMKGIDISIARDEPEIHIFTVFKLQCCRQLNWVVPVPVLAPESENLGPGPDSTHP